MNQLLYPTKIGILIVIQFYCVTQNSMNFLNTIWLCVVAAEKFSSQLAIAGIISLVAGMAALLHLKVVRSMKDNSEGVDSLLFSDVALGQAKARMHCMVFIQDLTFVYTTGNH